MSVFTDIHGLFFLPSSLHNSHPRSSVLVVMFDIPLRTDETLGLLFYGPPKTLEKAEKGIDAMKKYAVP